MKPIAIFYHCLMFLDSPDNLLESAVAIIRGQMQELKESELYQSSDDIFVGINGGTESFSMSYLLIPSEAQIKLHGLQCRNENRTILMVEDWAKNHPDWYVLYFHSKGATHPATHDFSTIWRTCMMKHVITNWRQCVKDLDDGYDAVGSHWMEPPETPEGHHIFAGNFWWAKSNFLRTLPSIMERDRIKMSGIDSIDSRFESEVWIGNGPSVPKVMDYHRGWNPSRIETCKQLCLSLKN